MDAPDNQTQTGIDNVTEKKRLRDIILELIERCEARGVVEPSTLQEILSRPVVAGYFQKNKERALKFIRYLEGHGIEILDEDIDKEKYASLPMVITVGDPIWVSYQDSIIGETFHFPNRYRDMVLPGRPFIYFRSASQRARGLEMRGYFGVGVIKDVWKDPRQLTLSRRYVGKRWCASICDYRPFEKTVYWTDGVRPIEDLDEYDWLEMVRDISIDTYSRILEFERSPIVAEPQPFEIGPAQIENLVAFDKLLEKFGLNDIVVETRSSGTLVMPKIEEVTPRTIDPSSIMMAIKTRPEMPSGESQKASSVASNNYRRSKNSVAIGNRAEEIVYRLLQDESPVMGYQSVRWVAREGEKPGWDIEVVDRRGVFHSVEVKGASGKIFPSIEVTAAEWQAAEERRERYWLFLVTECAGKHPKIQQIKDPVSLVQNGTLALSPLIWRLELSPVSKT